MGVKFDEKEVRIEGKGSVGEEGKRQNKKEHNAHQLGGCNWLTIGH
jgi:hypothetical protein